MDPDLLLMLLAMLGRNKTKQNQKQKQTLQNDLLQIKAS